MSMSKGVLATVTWRTKPELADTCVEALRGMFPTTRLKKGFRNIRLLRSEVDPNEFILVQEWDEVQDHQDYMQFRTETGELAKLMAMTVSPPQIAYWSLEPLAIAQA
jgi:quinol monooxygenase YgiN